MSNEEESGKDDKLDNRSGVIYIIENIAHPHLLKIGKTRKSARKRARELNEAREPGDPGFFSVLYERRTTDCHRALHKTHLALIAYQSPIARDLFDTSLTIGKAAVDEACTQADELYFVACERLAQKRREAERREAERREAERLEAERREAERLEAERREAERLEAERQEAQRQEAERLEAERLEAERLEAERREAMRREAIRIEAERREQARREAERREAARREAARLEAERLEAERVEAERREAERREAERLEAEYREAARLQAEHERKMAMQAAQRRATVRKLKVVAVLLGLAGAGGATWFGMHTTQQSQLQEALQRYAADYPIPPLSSTDETHLARVSAVGSALFFDYDITPLGERAIRTEFDAKLLEINVQDLACTKPELRAFMARGAQVTYRLMRASGESIVTPVFCP